MHDSLEQQLQKHSAALRGLARDLVGDTDADDLVQEAALQALRSPPARPGPLGGWLAAVVRHLASRHHRAQRRRMRREQLAARSEAAGPDASVEDQDTLRRLTEAVLALPEPYRGVVFLRYLKDLTPSVIALQSGEPVETIKSRLQRGLAMLRERLQRDGRDRGDGPWHAAFAAAFGLDRTALAGTGVLATNGVLLMGAGIKLVFGSAAAVVAVAAWLLVARGEPTGVPRPSEVPVAAASATVASTPTTAPGAEERREAAPTANAGDATRAGETVVRGRCVDEQGHPLAGCTVTLQGKWRERRSKDFAPELGAWLAARPDFRWQDREAITGADGLFVFAIAWSPLHFELPLRRDADALLLTPRIGALQAGEMRDLGDLLVPTTCSLRGRIVDAEGAPVCTSYLNVSVAEGELATTFTAPYSVTPFVRVDGTFATKLVAGSYDVTVPGRTVTQGQQLLVPVGTSNLEATIVVAAVAAALTITGTVVDERDVPLADIKVFSLGSQASYARTDARGAFVLCRSAEDTRTDAQLIVWDPAWAPYWSAEKVRWGSRDQRITLRPGLAVEVRVTAAADGRPVEDFALHFRGGSGNAVNFLSDDVARETGDHHENGIVRLAGIGPGGHALTVVPVRGDLAPSTAVPVAMPDVGSVRIDVVLQPATNRMLRVQFADGRPAPGTTVELIDPHGREVTTQTVAVAFAASEPHQALRVQRGTTDAGGELRLCGARNQRFVLRLSGKGHPPLIVADVDLDAGKPLLVTLLRGARLEGTLGPAEIVRGLRAACGKAEGTAPLRRGLRPPGFRLLREEGTQTVSFPGKNDAAVQVADDGTFACDHIPAGTWQLALEGWSFDRPGRSGAIEPVATVELRDGQTSTVAVDLPAWLPASVEGQVLRNGVAWAEQKATLIVRYDDVLGRSQERWEQFVTDRDGRFAVRTRQGQAMVSVTLGRAEAWSALHATQEVFVAAGKVTGAVFAIDSGTLRLRLVGTDCAPVVGVPLVLVGDDRVGGSAVRGLTVASDAEGWIEVEGDTRALSVQALPQRLQSFEAQRLLMEKAPDGSADPLGEHRLTLGIVSGKRGETVELVLRLPPEWYR